jgi:hypothetical protein
MARSSRFPPKLNLYLLPEANSQPPKHRTHRVSSENAISNAMHIRDIFIKTQRQEIKRFQVSTVETKKDPLYLVNDQRSIISAALKH